GGTIQQKMARHAAEPIQPLEPFGVPQPLAERVAYMMAKNPAVRYQSAEVVAEQLAPFVEPAALQATPPAPPPTLASYEALLRQRQAAALPVALSAASAAAEVKEAGPGIQLAISGKRRPTDSAAAILKRRQDQQRRNLVIGGVLVVLLSVAGIVGFNMLGGFSLLKEVVEVVKPDDIPPPDDGGGPAVKVANAKAEANKPAVVPANDVPPASPPGSGGPAATNVGFQQEVIPDDGNLLWASPTTGQPVSFHCVPPLGQCFLIVRPAELLASEEGAKVLAALGPTFATQRAAWEAAAGFPLEEIEQLIVSLHNNDAQFPRTSFVVKTREPQTTEQLLSRWKNPSPAQEGMATYYTGAAGAYYISSSPAAERTFLMAAPRDVIEVAKLAGNPPLLIRDMERLRRSIDGDRHVNLLVYPQFLFNDDGEPLFAAERAKVRRPLGWLLGDGLQAVLSSLHLGNEFYFELRMLGSLDREPHKLSAEFGERLNQVPGGLEDYFVQLTPPAYWKKLAFRYPGMIRQLRGQMRVGVENDQAVVNTVLPIAAAHNLVLGGELLIATAPGETAVAVAAAPVPGGPKTLEEALQLKTTYSFDSQSLEFAMRDLAADVQGNLKSSSLEFAIKIIGEDLQADGITRNQTVRDFKQENQTVADILTALVRKANPDPAATAPDHPAQKLLWVIGPDPEDPGKQVILITTRAAATAKKYTLPQHFVLKNTATKAKGKTKPKTKGNP
ncbi:MAG: hypothetical protein WD872_09895, partial [Pirellulaceae bacterium]